MAPRLVKPLGPSVMANEYNRRLRIYLGLAPVALSSGPERRPFGLSLSRRW